MAFDAEKLGSLARAFEHKVLSLAVFHPELLGEIHKRITEIPEDDEVMDIIDHENGFKLVDYLTEDDL